MSEQQVTTETFQPRYQLWVDLGRPEGFYAIWSTKMWQEFEKDLFGYALKERDHDFFVIKSNQEGDRLTRWLQRKYVKHAIIKDGGSVRIMRDVGGVTPTWVDAGHATDVEDAKRFFPDAVFLNAGLYFHYGTQS